MRSRLCGLLLALEASMMLTSCQTASEEPLGESLGIFEGTASLTATDCGAGVEAPETHELEFELLRSDEAIYWVQNGAALAGTYDDVELDWSSRVTSAVDSLCTLERQDSFEGELDDASAPARMEGTIVYEYDALDDSDCSSQTVENGGTFDALPCTVAYSYVVERD